MAKKVTIKTTSAADKLDRICSLMFEKLSDGELTILQQIMAHSDGSRCSMSADVKGAILRDTNLADGTISTLIARLAKKRVISKSGTVLTINPALAGLASESSFVVVFEQEKTGLE